MIALACDHAGIDLKAAVQEHLERRGRTVRDFGTGTTASCDYPDYALPAARAVASGSCELGILVCGSGAGMAIAANKVRGIRAVMCMTEIQARLARTHNDANVLTLGARLQGVDLALAVVDAFLEGAFAGGRHAGRVAKITAAEQENVP